MNKLLQRIVTAAILVVVLVIVFFRLPPIAAVTLVLAFGLIAAWEWGGFVWPGRLGLRLVYVAGLLILMVISAALFPARLPLQGLLVVNLLWWALAFVWVLRFPVQFGQVTGAVCGAMVLVPAWTALVVLLQGSELGPKYVLLVFAIVWAADVGAYFVGRRIGRKRMAPRVSPGKTWEGAVGGLVAAGVAGWLGGLILNIPLVTLVPLAIGIAFVSILGDLTVSMFKRNAGLKDSGQLFPGHGGVLDRIDSITAAVPLFVLSGTWLGVLEL
jgi:phosphatidate cytidylyltransferase